VRGHPLPPAPPPLHAAAVVIRQNIYFIWWRSKDVDVAGGAAASADCAVSFQGASSCRTERRILMWFLFRRLRLFVARCSYVCAYVGGCGPRGLGAWRLGVAVGAARVCRRCRRRCWRFCWLRRSSCVFSGQADIIWISRFVTFERFETYTRRPHTPNFTR